MGNLMSIFFPKAAAPAPLEQVATQGGEPNVVRVVNIVFHQYLLFFIAKIPIRPLWCESMGSFMLDILPTMFKSIDIIFWA